MQPKFIGIPEMLNNLATLCSKKTSEKLTFQVSTYILLTTNIKILCIPETE